MAGRCEHVNEPSSSIKGGYFLDQMSNYLLLLCSMELVVTSQHCIYDIMRSKYKTI